MCRISSDAEFGNNEVDEIDNNNGPLALKNPHFKCQPFPIKHPSKNHSDSQDDSQRMHLQ